jgi:hypothetical protein
MGKNRNNYYGRISSSGNGENQMSDAENPVLISDDSLKDNSSVFENSNKVTNKIEELSEAVPETDDTPTVEAEEPVVDSSVDEEPVVDSPEEPAPTVAPLSEPAKPEPVLPASETSLVNESVLALVNPAQNFTSDANIKSWETNNRSNIIRPIIENVFNEYEKNMRPKAPINRQKGAEFQTTLYQTIVRVAQTKAFFNENWDYILNRFYENPNNVYGINYVMRFVDAMSITKADAVLYPRLLNLLITTCDKKNMVENLRKVSLEKTLSNVASNTMRSNILGYYRQFVA